MEPTFLRPPDLNPLGGSTVVCTISREQEVTGTNLAIRLSSSLDKARAHSLEVTVPPRATLLPVVSLSLDILQRVLLAQIASIGVVGSKVILVGSLGRSLVEALLAVLPGGIVNESHVAGHVVVAEAAAVAEGEVVAHDMVYLATFIFDTAKLDTDAIGTVGVEVPAVDAVIENDVVEDGHGRLELEQVDTVVGVLVASNTADNVACS